MALFSTACADKNRGTALEGDVEQNSSLATSTNVTEAEDGPPFKVDCPCSFADLGRVRVTPERYDVLVSGKDWNPKLSSCNWIWNELVSNEVPPDTLITDLRIHLLDLSKVTQKIDKDFLESEVFKKNLIATHLMLPNEEYMTTKFDPNKTGKYVGPSK
ncbi:hypothetical protein MUN82_00110 [Hymenobacter aerilatus]|uniref:Uncharacterized protein n=1 Tax=Hymenobacter aerilatus TaxID=2932251 RepID=A0A8T9SZ57_9BACT|nr:hypothetical protein [Hymenobacter aerilatus]UOR05520.1 hypothetical protein MUN82_00110 [Hymenobacter aerilatus]